MKNNLTLNHLSKAFFIALTTTLLAAAVMPTFAELPTLADDTAIVNEDLSTVINVLANDNTLEGDLTLVEINTDIYRTQGNVTMTTDGQVHYEPGLFLQALPQDGITTDKFAYTVRNEDGVEASASVTITINGMNDAPQARNDTVSLHTSSDPVIIDVLANDSDTDVATSLSILGVDTRITRGRVTLEGNQIIYAVNGAFDGLPPGAMASDTFTYTAIDDHGATTIGTVNVYIINFSTEGETVGPPIDDTPPVDVTPVATAVDTDSSDGPPVPETTPPGVTPTPAAPIVINPIAEESVSEEPTTEEPIEETVEETDPGPPATEEAPVEPTDPVAEETDASDDATVIDLGGDDVLNRVTPIAPYNGTTFTSASDYVARPQWQAEAVAEWYHVYITTADYTTNILDAWYPATDAAGAEDGKAGICDGTTCTLPEDLWLPGNGGYVMWIGYWAESIDARTSETYQEIPFSVAMPAPLSVSATLEGNTLTWTADPGSQWHNIWLGTADYETTILDSWYSAADLCNADGVCSLEIPALSATTTYEIWMESWGPAGPADWFKAATLTATS